MTATLPAPIAHTGITRAADLEHAAELAARSLSPATLRAYSLDWAGFAAYAAGVPLATCAPATITALVAGHLGHIAARGAKASTIARAVAGIRWGLHRAGRTDEPTRDPVIAAIVRGAKRDPARAPAPARAVGLVDVVAMLATCEQVRDRAIILTLFAGGFRRSEVAALTVADLVDDGTRITVHVARSKTDQEGHGRYVVLHPGDHEATCPVAAVRGWLAVRGSILGAGSTSVFGLASDGVRYVVECAAARAGLTGVKPHGLRAGHVTEARRHGASAAQIRQTTGHADERMIAHYTRSLDAADNSARYLGL